MEELMHANLHLTELQALQLPLQASFNLHLSEQVNITPFY